MALRLVTRVIACYILPWSVLGLDFNIRLSQKQSPCQGCAVTLFYQYSHNSSVPGVLERENQIIWTLNGNSVLVVKRTAGSALEVDSTTNSRIQWAGPSDPGTITITDVHFSDQGIYECQVFYFSGQNVRGTVEVDASNVLATCRDNIATLQCGGPTAPVYVNTTAPTYSYTSSDCSCTPPPSHTTGGCSCSCIAIINWRDNSTGSMENLNITDHPQRANYTSGSCSGRNCSSLYVPQYGSGSSTVTYQPQWKIGSQMDDTPLPMCLVQQAPFPTTTMPSTIITTTGDRTGASTDPTTPPHWTGASTDPTTPPPTSAPPSHTTCYLAPDDCVLNSELDNTCLSGSCSLSNCAQLTTICQVSVNVCETTSMCNVTSVCNVTFNCTNTIKGCKLEWSSEELSIICQSNGNYVAIIVSCVLVGILLIAGGIIIYFGCIRGKKYKRICVSSTLQKE